MEAIITIVGFLGAGKTTLLKNLTTYFINNNWSPYIILNDYENASLDAHQFKHQLSSNQIKALNGSCICCSGINELRNLVNRIPERTNGITLIEANGTSDACSLMGFLGIGLDKRYLPPIQVSVVDMNNWQKRGEHNELEANQIQVSSLIVLTHLDNTSPNRKDEVLQDIKDLNPKAIIVNINDIEASLLPNLIPSENIAHKFDHQKAHWSSCSVDLPNLPDENCIREICEALPKSILRVKGCTIISDQQDHTYFERKPDGEIHIRPFNGTPIMGSKLLTVGPGSEPETVQKIITTCLKSLDPVSN